MNFYNDHLWWSSSGRPMIMGIINITPDSFYAKSQYQKEGDIKTRIEQMMIEGVDIIDIGAQSTNPRSHLISQQEEYHRLLPYLKLLSRYVSQMRFSIDTFYAANAALAIDHGFHMINDISGGRFDDAMLPLVKRVNLPFVVGHLLGTAQSMHSCHTTYTDVVKEVYDYFDSHIKRLQHLGIQHIIVDVGIGFSKQRDHNFTLIKRLSTFKTLKYPLLIGLSRKSFLYKTLGINAEDALNATTAMHVLALQNGANIIRVHDVKESKQVVQILQHYGSC